MRTRSPLAGRQPQLQVLEHHSPVPLDVHGFELRCFGEGGGRRGAAPDKGVLLDLLQTQKGLQRAFTKQLSPRGQRQMRCAGPHAGCVPAPDPLPLGEHAMHKRVVQRPDDPIGHASGAQQRPNGAPVHLGPEPEDPDHAAGDAGGHAGEVTHVAAQAQAEERSEHHESHGPCQGRLEPSISACGRCQEQKCAQPKANQRHPYAAGAGV